MTATTASSPLAESLRLPCGAVLPNRIAKAAMTEGLADGRLRATEGHARLYRQWSHGGAGLLITGNVMIDARVLERPGNVAIDGNGGLDALRAWARAGTEGGNHLWMQISHAGRQSPRYVTRQPLAPSTVQLDMVGNYARPRALTEPEILDFIERFGRVAEIARDCGFTGVQIHGAHGYLLSSFLSPVTNRRTDAWGGSLPNRARFLLEAVRAVRRRVGADFPVAVKLNSDDFRKGGFSHDDCLQVVRWLDDEAIDLLEISGGTYEQPRMMGQAGRDDTEVQVRQSSRAREAYFLDYAASVRRVTKLPLMVTGGFRSRAGMEAALASEDCDLIGVGRPLCTNPDAPRRLLDGDIDTLPSHEHRLRLARTGLLSPASPLYLARIVNTVGPQGWYYQQLLRLGAGRQPQLSRGVVAGFARYWIDELTAAARRAAG